MLYPVSPTSGVPDVNSVLQVSYMEIYCERVRDLLNPKNNNQILLSASQGQGGAVMGV